MSARAAARLERLGFSQVYRYVPGKVDWFAFGWPMEGERAQLLQAKDAVRSGVPTCRPDEPLGRVHQHAQDAGWKVCIVTDERGVVLGRLRREAWEADPDAPAEAVMEEGPTTFRPDYGLETLVKRMRHRNVGSVVITNSDGVLIGVLYRSDGEQRLGLEPAGAAASPDGQGDGKR